MNQEDLSSFFKEQIENLSVLLKEQKEWEARKIVDRYSDDWQCHIKENLEKTHKVLRERITECSQERQFEVKTEINKMCKEILEAMIEAGRTQSKLLNPDPFKWSCLLGNIQQALRFF